MFEHVKFDVDIVRDVSVLQLYWPESGDVEDERAPCGNMQYMDLREIPWDEALSTLDEEGVLLKRLDDAVNPDEECGRIHDELYEDPELLGILDFGVAATVAVLSAAGCIPCTSCNGGAFRESHHHSRHPLVVFFCPIETLPILLNCAEQADVGLERTDGGALIVYSDNIVKMHTFAELVAKAIDRT